MERWLEFMGNHPFLFGTLGVLIVLFFILEGQRNGRKISPQSLGILVKAKNAMLIDLRDAKDFRDGHISGSRNIPYSQITSHVDELKASDRPLVFISLPYRRFVSSTTYVNIMMARRMASARGCMSLFGRR